MQEQPMRPRSWSPGRLALALALLALAPAAARAQYDAPPAAAAYALTNVTVVQADGRRQPGMTVVVRRGRIEVLGAGLAAPADARVLAGESLVVYPGLVDAEGGAKLELPEPRRGPDLRSWDAPREAQGFTPHRRAVDYLKATGGDLAGERGKGVVASAALPQGGVAPGHAAVLLHRAGAGRPAELVALPEAGLVLSFDGARGAYPSTVFGIMAFLRQAFSDAARQEQVRLAYARDARGVDMPVYDPDFEALRRAAAGELPVFFPANGAEEIRRVLGLARELGFRPVIVGGQEAWKEAAALRAQNVPVLVSLDFPKPEAWKPEAPAAAGAAPAELDAAAQREKQRLEEIYANAGKLARAGVAIALTSGGGKAELRDGARKAIAYGLEPAAALQALTGAPARLLGVPALARLEPGLSATFIVTDGDLFDEKTAIVYTFVEGVLTKGQPGARPAAAGAAGRSGAAAARVAGDWRIEVQTAGVSYSFDMNLEQSGESFSGTLRSGELGAGSVRSGQISGSDVTFTLTIRMGPQTIEGNARGTVDGDRMSGGGTHSMGSFTFTGSRRPGGAARGGVR
jgi:imidazolonepropionase-like amidohydrolase